jgi:F-type H+-transporting ATPase subunit a
VVSVTDPYGSILGFLDRSRLLTLLGNNGPTIRQSLIGILITGQILLLVLESAVAIIQSYVFAVVRTLYSREVT